MDRASNAIRRSAVYTRKSSEEGLEPGLQFPACAARGRRGVHQKPAGRRLETRQDELR
jgi:hypothetical protein